MRALFILLLLTGCAIGPRYRRPEVSMPETFECGANTEEPWVCWWQQLGDPILDSLIDRALACNLDVKEAAAKAQKVRGKYIATQSILWPYINAVFNPIRWELSQDFPFVTPSAQFNTFDLFFDATWELDIFGKNRRLVQAKAADYQAHLEGYRNVMVTLIGEMGRTYIDLRNYQKQMEHVEKIKELQTELVTLVQEKLAQNLASEIDLANAKKEVLKTEGSIKTLKQAITESINGIALIVSELPGNLECELCKPADLPTLPDCLPVGLPCQLLCRRPDIREAEKKLEARVAEVGFSIADFFPQIDLTANIGLLATQLSQLFQNGNQNEIFGAGILFPIFRGGQLVGEYKAAKAEQKAALYNYANTVLKAFHDIDNALTGYRNEQERYQTIHQMAEQQISIQQKVNALQKEGLADKKQTIEEHLALLSITNEETQSYAKQLTKFVALYKALGGGWSCKE